MPDRNQQALDKSDRLIAHFAVIVDVVLGSDCKLIIKNQQGDLETQPMAALVDLVFPVIPISQYLHTIV